MVAQNVINHFYSHQFASTSPALEPLGSAGGFSGARFWRINDGHKRWCLRLWPKQQSSSINSILSTHRSLAKAFASGCHFVPVPLPNRTGETLTFTNGQVWQLEPWMPGQSNFLPEARPERLRNAVQALALFHRSLSPTNQFLQTSPGIQARRTRLNILFQENAPTPIFLEIEQSACSSQLRGIEQLATRICTRFRSLAGKLVELLNHAGQQDVEIQPIHGDCWHDHILFTGDSVTGLVDFGTMRVDSPIADLARLLSSFRLTDQTIYRSARTWYREIHSIESTAFALIKPYDLGTLLLGCVNWLDWICVEKRDFGDLSPVISRLESHLKRIDDLQTAL